MSRGLVTISLAPLAQHVIVGCGDFDGDGGTDILYQDDNTGALKYWRMNGYNLISTRTISTGRPNQFVVGGVGDVTGDGKTDVIWHNEATRAVRLWSLNADLTATSFNVGTAPVGTVPRGGGYWPIP